MSSGTPIKKNRATVAAAKRAERTESRAQRQQLRAMEARAAKTGTAPTAVVDDELEFVEVGGTGAAVMRRGKPALVKPVVLTRMQEYAYIRSDLRRLVIVAAGLFVLMLILLFVLG